MSLLPNLSASSEKTMSSVTGFTGEKHTEVFERPPKGPRKEGQLSEEQLNEYYEKGFTVIHDFFTKEELDTVINDISELLDNLTNKLFEAGKIKNTYKELGFYERLTAIEKEHPGSNIILHKTDKLTQGMRNIANHQKMLNLLEDILGPDIGFNPVWNLRTKTPQNDATVVPWHQDSAYYDNESYTAHIVAAWIPLINATKENGTMQMVPRGHRQALVAEHTCCAGPTWYVMLDEDEIEKRLDCKMSDAEVIEIPMGSFVLFNNFTPHRSLANMSQDVRWALDFRWQKVNSPSGLFGLKDKLTLRLGDQPDYVPDFEAFDNVPRNSKQIESVGKVNDPFSTIISGPWMKKWHLVNHNRHTAAFDGDSDTWDSSILRA